MAAVTVTKTRININGAFREKYYTINIATSGDTLQTNMKNIIEADSNNVAITLMTPTAGSVAFTTTGAVTGALVKFVGW